MISEEIQCELRNRYNPEGSDLRLLQKHLLILLQHFDTICRKNNINYWLSSGTCLGAVRHKGFIPWDDDIDIEMTREDYMKFASVWQDDEDFVLQTYKNDLYYTQPFSKLRLRKTFVYEGCFTSLYQHKGIFLDIFIVEPSNAIVAHFCHFILGSLRHLSFHIKPCVISNLIFKFLKKICFGIINGMKFLTCFAKKDEMRYTNGTGAVKSIIKQYDIYPLSELEFEGRIYPVPGNVDGYLKRIFGNYMEIPNVLHNHSLQNITFLGAEDFERLNSL